MTVVSSIITSALRETNLISIGAVPTAEETSEALLRFQSLILSVLGNETGEHLTDLPLGRNEIDAPSGYPSYGNTFPVDSFIPLNKRVILNLTAASTINLHPCPCDGARFAVVDTSKNLATRPLTINGNGRLIEGAVTATLNTNNLSREWFYRADLGDWKRVSTLALTDEMPYPVEFDDMFIILLAMRLNPRFGQALAEESQAALKRSRSQFRSRYKQIIPTESEIGLLNLTNTQVNGYDQGYRDSSAMFNSGYPL